jgi:hypothetical protein
MGLNERVQTGVDIELLATPRRESWRRSCTQRRVAHDLSPTPGRRGTTRLEIACILAGKASEDMIKKVEKSLRSKKKKRIVS